MQQLRIDDFLAWAQRYPVIDVRSPGEYRQAHIPGAYSMPLFTDEERKVVGTAYKQQSREQAIKEGLDYFGPKMRKMVEEVEALLADRAANGWVPAGDKNNTVLVHCWRGGMRSGGVAWLLNLYGFRVVTLKGGYKAYRNWVLQQFKIPYRLKVLGGYTGSGKTVVLQELHRAGKPVIDLEGIARHKGSAFGGVDKVQPTQEQFENDLAAELFAVVQNHGSREAIWVEDESQRIGGINIPGGLWQRMRMAPVYYLLIDFDSRLQHIMDEYGRIQLPALIDAVTRIQKRLGNEQARQAIRYLDAGDVRSAFRILLAYYDKYYERGIKTRDQQNALARALRYVYCPVATAQAFLMAKAAGATFVVYPIYYRKNIACPGVDTVANSRALVEKTNENG